MLSVAGAAGRGAGSRLAGASLVKGRWRWARQAARLECAFHASEREGGHPETADGAARAHGVRVAWAEEGGGVGTSDSGSCVDGEHEHVRAVELVGQGQAAEDQPDELPPQRRVWVWVWRVGLHTMGGGRARDGVVEAALRTLLNRCSTLAWAKQAESTRAGEKLSARRATEAMFCRCLSSKGR